MRDFRLHGVDGLGTPICFAGFVVAFTPYGGSRREVGRSVIGFTGLPRAATGNLYIPGGYRVLNTSLMRFTSPDNLSPFGKGGLNGYAYCANDPVNRRDPSGHVFINRKTHSSIRKIGITESLPDWHSGFVAGSGGQLADRGYQQRAWFDGGGVHVEQWAGPNRRSVDITVWRGRDSIRVSTAVEGTHPSYGFRTGFDNAEMTPASFPAEITQIIWASSHNSRDETGRAITRWMIDNITPMGDTHRRAQADVLPPLVAIRRGQ